MNEEIRTPLVLKNKDLWDMAKTIVDKIKSANCSTQNECYWESVENEWFNWLEEKIFGEQT